MIVDLIKTLIESSSVELRRDMIADETCFSLSEMIQELINVYHESDVNAFQMILRLSLFLQ